MGSSPRPYKHITNFVPHQCGTTLNTNVCKENITPPSMETKETVMEDDIFHDAEDDDELPSLLDFEVKCPPGGGDCVVLYSTSVTGVRKTFEDCKAIRFLLESFKVPVYERDLSMHMEFREELWRIFGGRVIPPRLFIKGRYIGGAEEVTALHEQGKLKKLLEGIPIHLFSSPCTGCANLRFVVCFNCNGSRKVFTDGDHENDELCIRCPECNENGLIKCSICSSKFNWCSLFSCYNLSSCKTLSVCDALACPKYEELTI